MRFSTFDKCNLYQNRNENLAFFTRAHEYVKKYLKNRFDFFLSVVGDPTLRPQLPRG